MNDIEKFSLYCTVNPLQLNDVRISLLVLKPIRSTKTHTLGRMKNFCLLNLVVNKKIGLPVVKLYIELFFFFCFRRLENVGS